DVCSSDLSYAGATPVGDQLDILVVGVMEQGAYIGTGVREGHAVRELANITATHGQPVWQALAPGVSDPGLRAAVDQIVNPGIGGQPGVRNLLTGCTPCDIRQRRAAAYTVCQKCLTLLREFQGELNVTVSILKHHFTQIHLLSNFEDLIVGVVISYQ